MIGTQALKLSRGAMLQSSSRLHNRTGISLLEVIFATGVLLIGLMGLAAVLPVATNNARRSLESDRSKEVFNNQDATRSLRGLNDVSLLSSYFYGENSLTRFRVQKSDFLSGKSTKSPALYPTVDVTGIVDLPPVFCVDPWFLTAANTARDDTTTDGVDFPNMNGFDRSLFPCYDEYYDPSQSPSLKIERNAIWAGRRMPRVSISQITSVDYNEVMANDFDAISVVLNPDDKSLPPGLFVKRANDGLTRTSTSLKGRYSYLMTMRRNGTGHIVVFKDRNVVIDQTGDYGLNDVLGNTAPNGPRHKLTPYNADAFGAGNALSSETTFADERIGWVTQAKKVLRGNSGSFEFRTNKYVDPNVLPGDWVMLLRRNYAIIPGPIKRPPVARDLDYAWCQVLSVDQPAALVGDYYTSRITVSDVNWLFHPLQAYDQLLGFGPYRKGEPPKGWDESENYDGDINDEYLYGTIVVLMKDVVSVRPF